VEKVDVAVVGGGQAGLAASHQLTQHGLEHVVLERGRVGETWRRRWDSFCLVTPNWTVQLPGHPYAGADPDGYMPRDEIVEHLESYASTIEAPVRTGVEVESVDKKDSRFRLRTSQGAIDARVVILATGAYQRPHRPPIAAAFPADLAVIDVDGYRSPSHLPDGPVLVVGSGQSGCQLAEELIESGREVVLSCGRAPWAPRRLGGRDIVWWLTEDGFLDQRVDALPSPDARLFANIVTTGHGGGHDLHLRTLRDMGVALAGHLIGVDGRRARFANDLVEAVAWGDERYRMLTEDLPGWAARLGVPAPEIPVPEPFASGGLEELDLTGFGAVIFTTGFRPDYGALVPWPEALDEHGFPVQVDGASTVVPGLYFLGVHFLRKRKSSLLSGVGEDSGVVAAGIGRSRDGG
jgi:putative flavoprotein involved in K+ transport